MCSLCRWKQESATSCPASHQRRAPIVQLIKQISRVVGTSQRGFSVSRLKVPALSSLAAASIPRAVSIKSAVVGSISFHCQIRITRAMNVAKKNSAEQQQQIQKSKTTSGEDGMNLHKRFLSVFSAALTSAAAIAIRYVELFRCRLSWGVRERRISFG
jgi:hypothetical protein